MPEEPGASGGGKTSWFTTLPGILTGTAAVLTATGTLAGIFLTRGDGGDAGDPPPGNVISVVPDATTTVPEGPTRAAWARKANAICRRTAASLTPQTIAINQAQTIEEVIAASAQVVQAALGMVDEIRALEAPAGDEQRIATMVDAWRETLRTVQDGVDAARLGDVNAFAQTYARAANLAEEGNAVADDLGADACVTAMSGFEQFG